MHNSDEPIQDEHRLLPSDSHSLSPSEFGSLELPLLADSDHSSSHALSHINNSPLNHSSPSLLDVTPAVRSLIWQYMDNRSAIHYLITCKQLHALYHSFPLTEAVTEAQWLSIVLRLYRRTFCIFGSSAVYVVVFIAFFVLLWLAPPQPAKFVILPILFVLFAAYPIALLLAYLFPGRSHCCDEAKRLSGRMRHTPIPRIVRLTAWCGPHQLAYLQHVEEVKVVDWLVSSSNSSKITTSSASCVSADAVQLPHTLRKLVTKPVRKLSVDTLSGPPHLTALAMDNVSQSALQIGVLPAQLVTLCIWYTVEMLETEDERLAVQPIPAGVLPPHLQQLEITWPLSLADLALPSSLIRLELNWLPDMPIPVGCLPDGLQHLRLTCHYFDPHHLMAALPSGLRVLRLLCELTHPLTADICARMPRLEELDLDPECLEEWFTFDVLALALYSLPQLRVLRLGAAYCQPIPAACCLLRYDGW